MDEGQRCLGQLGVAAKGHRLVLVAARREHDGLARSLAAGAGLALILQGDLLSGSPSTAMFGNLINSAIAVPAEVGQGAAFLVLMFVVLLAPMVYYIRATERQEGETV